MVEIKYNGVIQKEAIQNSLKRLTNQIYKLLPVREESGDWESPLITILVELAGMTEILIDYHNLLLPLLAKLEGLLVLTAEKDFSVYRKTIFESLSILSRILQTI